MRIDRIALKKDIEAIINTTDNHKQKQTLKTALTVIRQMEGDLRRQGFIEYTDKEEQ